MNVNFIFCIALTLALAVLCGLKWKLWRNWLAALRRQERLRERQRIARILHDNFLQQCQYILLTLEHQADRPGLPPEDKATLLRLAAHANEALVDGRDLIVQLRQDGLSACLGERINALGAMLSKARLVAFSCNLRPALYDRRDESSDELFMLLAEAIRNAFMHSGATSILVSDSGCAENTWIFVSDNGVGGLRAADFARHHGLLGMQERAQLLGATLSLDSTEGGGTTLSLRIQCRRWI